MSLRWLCRWRRNGKGRVRRLPKRPDDVVYDYGGELPPPRLPGDTSPLSEMEQRGYLVAFTGHDTAVGSDYVAYMKAPDLAVPPDDEDEHDGDPLAWWDVLTASDCP